MVTHSSVLAWRIPGTGEPGGLPSMGLHRVGHDWSDLAAAAGCQLGHWAFPRRPLAGKRHRPLRASVLVLVQSLSCVQLFATPWTAAHLHYLLEFLKLMSTESVTPSNHLILCCPFSSCPQCCPVILLLSLAIGDFDKGNLSGLQFLQCGSKENLSFAGLWWKLNYIDSWVHWLRGMFCLLLLLEP